MTSDHETAAGGSDRAAAARIAWGAWLVLIALCAAAFLVQLSTSNAWLPNAYGFPGFSSIFALTCGTVAAVVLSRRPSNRVGRVLLAAGLIAAFQSLYTEYAIASYLIPRPAPLPFAPIAAWLVSWAWLPFVFLAGPLLLSLFPDGRFLSFRWRLVPVAIALDAAVFAILAALRSGPIDNFEIIDNPFGVLPADVVNVVARPFVAGMTLGFVLPAASVVVRYRRSDAERRQQLKWIAAAGVLVAVAAPFGFSGTKLGQLLFILAISGIPIATGIAVLRYRLYEIDTIINRALVYGLMTAVIAGIYTASVGVMQRLTQGVTGADSQLTAVVTTVLIVTAFTPIKTRLQGLVDRRFKDAGDAKATFDAFTKALHERIWPIDARLALRRFAETAVSALRANGVEVSLGPGDRPVLTVRADGREGDGAAATGGSTTTLESTVGATTLRMRVAAGERELADRDRQAAIGALASLAAELEEG